MQRPRRSYICALEVLRPSLDTFLCFFSPLFYRCRKLIKGKDPFYSCNQVYDECVNSDGTCKSSLEYVRKYCPGKDSRWSTLLGKIKF